MKKATKHQTTKANDVLCAMLSRLSN